jgi:hypothetical protein
MPDDNRYGFSALSGTCIKRVLHQLERPSHPRGMRGLARLVHARPNVAGLVPLELMLMGLLVFL